MWTFNKECGKFVKRASENVPTQQESSGIPADSVHGTNLQAALNGKALA